MATNQMNQSNTKAGKPQTQATKGLQKDFQKDVEQSTAQQSAGIDHSGVGTQPVNDTNNTQENSATVFQQGKQGVGTHQGGKMGQGGEFGNGLQQDEQFQMNKGSNPGQASQTAHTQKNASETIRNNEADKQNKH